GVKSVIVIGTVTPFYQVELQLLPTAVRSEEPWGQFLLGNRRVGVTDQLDFGATHL
ncbi:unnamed protein product, partial [marine sediment metagenome]